LSSDIGTTSSTPSSDGSAAKAEVENAVTAIAPASAIPANFLKNFFYSLHIVFLHFVHLPSRVKFLPV